MRLPESLRPMRLVRVGAIGLLALVLVLMLPSAPAQNRDLGTVRTEGSGGAAPTPASAAAGMAKNLPYRPFIDPIRAPVHTRWYLLLLPMSLGVALVYKAVALHTLERYWQQVMYLTVQIIVGMMALGLASYLLVMNFVPWMAGR